MSRPLRVEYPHAIYHVISRGNTHEDIFLNEADRKKFLVWINDVVQVHNLVCYAYCLMSNHYHLLIETPDANLAQAMRDLNGNYAQWFNAVHNRIGHLFQGRYKAFVIERESYLLEVARYIVLNPVRANLIPDPKLWKWSSFRATSGSEAVPTWLSIDWLLGNFSTKKDDAQNEYNRFVRAGIHGKDPYDDLEHGFLLGTPQFVYQIWKKTNGSEELKDYPRKQRIVGRPTLKEIFSEVTSKQERDNAIIFARERCGYLVSEIASCLGLDQSTIGKIAKGNYHEKSDVRT